MAVLRRTDRDFDARLSTFIGNGEAELSVRQVVAEIIADVRTRGDVAVLYHTARFDHAKLNVRQLRVPEEHMLRALKALTPERRKAIDEAIRCVRDFHKRTLPKSWLARNPHGAQVGERHLPIQRCGLYIPGGQAPLVSSVIMSAIPAQVAGVPHLVACTPPNAEGKINADLLATLYICGVKEVYVVGGAQAIAAMALGTASIPSVDKIFGPGNAYVTEAKRQLFGLVGIDLLPGPSEVMIIADKTANPEWVGADLCAQAEHGSGKEKLYLVSDDEAVASACERSAISQCNGLANGEKIRRILSERLLTILVPKIEDAAAVANRVSPEHLQLMVADRKIQALSKAITTAGAQLLGAYTPTVIGDFTAGPSHTLPTGGTGRFFSGLRVTDFLRRTSIVRYDKVSAKRASAVVEAFAKMERLDAHGRSLSLRLPKR
jgi:histidinol dehydrogenase